MEAKTCGKPSLGFFLLPAETASPMMGMVGLSHGARELDYESYAFTFSLDFENSARNDVVDHCGSGITGNFSGKCLFE
jgi:hypothetical protein